MGVVTLTAGANIQVAIDAYPAGTVFQLAAGMYRGQQFLAKSNDQFIGDPSGATILNGALLLSGWSTSGGYWHVSGLPAPLTGHGTPGSNPLALDLNDLFVDNVVYTRVAALSEVTAGRWYFDPATNSVYISDNPTGHAVEYSALPNLTRDNGAIGVVLQNLTVEKYATDAQNGAIQAVRDWRIEGVTARWNHGAGLSVGSGTVVEGGHYIDNGQAGIEGYNMTGAKVLDAEIARNNYAGYDTEWDAGGLKMVVSSNIVVSGNNVHDNYGQGIWGDWDSSAWTISGNVVSHNDGAGIMYEISHGATQITNNTVSNNSGSGIYISNADGVAVSGNTVSVKPTSTAGGKGAAWGGGIDIINAARGSGPDGVYQAINDSVTHNTIVHAGDTARDGIYVLQDFTSSPNNVWDGNTYYVSSETGAFWHFGTTDYTWNTLHQSTPYESIGTDVVGLPPAPAGAAVPSSVVTPDRLTLLLAEDRHGSDIQFIAKLDGATISGPLTVTCLHSSGGSQFVTFSGFWGIGPHDLEIDVLNSSAKRDQLYVNQVDFDDKINLSTPNVLYPNSSIHIAIGH